MIWYECDTATRIQVAEALACLREYRWHFVCPAMRERAFKDCELILERIAGHVQPCATCNGHKVLGDNYHISFDNFDPTVYGGPDVCPDCKGSGWDESTVEDGNPDPREACEDIYAW